MNRLHKCALPALVLSIVTASCASLRSPNRVEYQPSRSVTPWAERLISPVTSPTTFETPVIGTEVRPMFLHQNLPGSSAFGGGDFQLFAVQARYALTERLALIATKDGYIDFNPATNPLGDPSEEGLADIAAGVKYALLSLPERGILVTSGLVYEIDSGDHEVFQGNGDGLIRPFVSAGWDNGEINVLGGIGWNQPLDSSAESTSFDYHLHLDYQVEENLYPLIELNGITYTENGSAFAFDFEGGDLINLGSGAVAGNSVVSGALGARYAINDNAMIGLAYEIPLTDRKDLLQHRVTIDMIWSF